ncbi:hypothetical protein GE061_015718 [Apolygus lucorum]|uniref:Uncharacterized protein n=1 Tax=Apolygus lucorum TaxID=248454 RepID=A0A8S9XLZ4_APOLU|nr:hypothetical protein GE061_015718 [Apolygus lucorum]
MPDYVDIAVSSEPEKPDKKKRTGGVCHPIVIAGLVTTIIYGIFISLMVTYLNVEGFRDFIHSLKRLANIKEWFRIIFKPWETDGSSGGYNRETTPANSIPARDSDLDPDVDVKILD